MLLALLSAALLPMQGQKQECYGNRDGGIHQVWKGEDGKARALPSRKIRPHNVKEGRVESDGSLQLSFFQLEDPLLMSLRDRLNSADLDNMTPMQAFDLLRNLKSQMEGK